MKHINSSNFNVSLNKGLFVNKEGRLTESQYPSVKQISMRFDTSYLEEWEDEDYSLLIHPIIK